MASSNSIPLPEAAQLLKMSWPRAWRLVLAGEIRAMKVDGRWLCDRKDVQKLLKASE